jgi:hypothetical protein
VTTEEGFVAWRSERHVDEYNGHLEQFSQPGVITPSEDLIIVARLRHEGNPMFEFGLYGQNRLGDFIPEESIGQHRFIEYQDPITEPENTWRYERGSPASFTMDNDTDAFMFQAQIINPREPQNQGRRGWLELDSAYVGPEKLLVILRPEDYPAAVIKDGSPIPILYYVAGEHFLGNRVRLQWTYNPFAEERMLYDIAGATGLFPERATPFRWENASEAIQSVTGGLEQEYVYLVAQLYDSVNQSVYAEDIGGPIHLDIDSDAVTPTATATATPISTPTSTQTLNPTLTPTPTATGTMGETSTPTMTPLNTPVFTPEPGSDINGDGVVDMEDLLILQRNWLREQ